MTSSVARAQMLIRRPVEDVFNAFVQPDVITRFWLDETTGPLAPAARVEWRFMVPGATETVTVTAFDDQRLIAFDWSDGIQVRLAFSEYAGDSTRVVAEASGFQDEPVLDAVVNATEGFSIVLCDLKTLLETGRSAGLVRDKAVLIAGG